MAITIIEVEKTVLAVGNDEELLSMLSEKLGDEKNGSFLVKSASDGEEAVAMLKKGNISVVVTALAMPKVDGLVLLDYMRTYSPAVPCIVIADESTPDVEKNAKELGAIAFIKKPLDYTVLAAEIMDVFHEQEDGGFLRDMALEIFAHLVQMEGKSCIIRTRNIKAGDTGSLLFVEGELCDASCPGLNGLEAAYEIFTWGKVELSIQNSCHLKEDRINIPLQGILLEAMRLKDEKERDEQEAGIKEIEEKKDTLNVDEPESWDGLMQMAGEIGSFFQLGPLKTCSLSDGKGMELLLVVEDSNLVVKDKK